MRETCVVLYKSSQSVQLKWQLEGTTTGLALLVATAIIPAVMAIAQSLVVSILVLAVMMNVWRKVMVVLLQLDAKHLL